MSPKKPTIKRGKNKRTQLPLFLVVHFVLLLNAKMSYNFFRLFLVVFEVVKLRQISAYLRYYAQTDWTETERGKNAGNSMKSFKQISVFLHFRRWQLVTFSRFGDNVLSLFFFISATVAMFTVTNINCSRVKISSATISIRSVTCARTIGKEITQQIIKTKRC